MKKQENFYSALIFLSPALITPFPVSALNTIPNKVATKVPNNFQRNPLFWYFV